jgi:polyhydroxyalkanoate synthesis regulator phasin
MSPDRSEEKSASQPAQETDRRVSDEMNRTAQTAAELTEHTAQASAEIVQRNTQIVQQAWEMSSKMAAQLTQQSVDELARAFGISGEEAQKAAQQSALNLEMIIGSSAALAEGMQTISQEWLEFAQSRVEQNRDWFNALVRTPQNLTAMQSEMIQADLQRLLQSARRTAEISARAANNATRKLAEQVHPMRQAA